MKDRIGENHTGEKGIDLVYLWVDGNDPEWRRKRQAIDGLIEDNTDMNCKGRHVDNEELRYSLRSVEKHAPWIRNIFIVTNEQTPEWLDLSNPKVKIVDHKDIIPEEGRPCFNASVIEYFLYKIPGLSEYFLYANDDMFFSADVTPGFFFQEDGFPVIRLKRNTFGRVSFWLKYLRKRGPGQYRKIIHDAASLVNRKFGKYYTGLPHHNIDSYRKSDFQLAIEDVFKEQVEESQTHHVRTFNDFQRSALSYFFLATGRGHLKYAGRRESIRIPAQRADYMKYILKYQPQLCCINDSQRVTDEDRKRIRPFLEELFPEKSSFEK